MLSKDILENIQTLLAVTSSINETYTKLDELEANDKKENSEYKSYIASLKSSLELEKSIYERFPNDLDVLSKIEYVINDNKDYWLNFNLQENIDAILNHNNYIKLRIHLKLFNKMLGIKNAEFIINTNDKDVLNKQSTRSILIINATVIRDFLNTLVVILNSYLNDPKYNVIKNLLLDVKYGISYLYEEIENDFLENNFNINSDLYWVANVVADYYQLDTQKLKAIQRGTVYNLYVNKINNIIKISLDENSDKQEIFDYVIGEILVRVSLILFGDKTVEFLKKQRLQLSPTSPHDAIGMEILGSAQKRVDKVFEIYDKDKELPQVISLKVRK